MADFDFEDVVRGRPVHEAPAIGVTTEMVTVTLSLPVQIVEILGEYAEVHRDFDNTGDPPSPERAIVACISFTLHRAKLAGWTPPGGWRRPQDG